MELRVLVLGLSALIAAIAAHALGVAGDGMPTLTSPYPMLLVIPAFLGVPPILLSLGYGASFALWSQQLFFGNPAIPRRSVALFVISCLLSGVIFLGGWGYGLRHQGASYVYSSFVLSVLCVTALVILLLLNSRTPRLASSMAFHFVLFGWLCTYAMPYLGEMPQQAQLAIVGAGHERFVVTRRGHGKTGPTAPYRRALQNMKKQSLASQVSSVLFAPTIFAYGCLIARYVLLGMGIYAFFLAAGYIVGYLDRLKDWPAISRTALFLGPLLIGMGFYFSTQPPTYWILVPPAVYLGLSMVGGIALMEP